MAASEVTVTEVAPGLLELHVDGVRIPHVHAYTVSRRVGGPDIVTFEIASQRTTVTPAPITTGLEELEARDAEIDARMASGGTVGA